MATIFICSGCIFHTRFFIKFLLFTTTINEEGIHSGKSMFGNVPDGYNTLTAIWDFRGTQSSGFYFIRISHFGWTSASECFIGTRIKFKNVITKRGTEFSSNEKAIWITTILFDINVISFSHVLVLKPAFEGCFSVRIDVSYVISCEEAFLVGFSMQKGTV